MFIHWDPSLDTGQPLIDSEHRILVFLFRKLDVGIKTGMTEVTLRQTVLELRRFIEFHFVSEENLMRETEYPGLEEHRMLHMELLTELNSFIAKLATRREYPEDLLGFLNQWLVDHIAHHDRLVARHVDQALKRPLAEANYAEYLVATDSLERWQH